MSVLNTVPKYRGKGIHIWVGLVLLVFILIQTVSGILMLAGDHGGRDGGRYGGPAAQFRNAPGNAPMMQNSGVPMGRQGVLNSTGAVMQNISFMPGRLNGGAANQSDQLGDGTVMPQQGRLGSGGSALQPGQLGDGAAMPQPGQLNGNAVAPQSNGDQLAQTFGNRMGRHGAFNSMGDPGVSSGFGSRFGESDGLSVRGIHGSWFLAIATLILLLIHVYYSLGLHFFGFKYRKKQAIKDVDESAELVKPVATQDMVPNLQ